MRASLIAAGIVAVVLFLGGLSAWALVDGEGTITMHDEQGNELKRCQVRDGDPIIIGGNEEGEGSLICPDEIGPEDIKTPPAE